MNGTIWQYYYTTADNCDGGLANEQCFPFEACATDGCTCEKWKSLYEERDADCGVVCTCSEDLNSGTEELYCCGGVQDCPGTICVGYSFNFTQDSTTFALSTWCESLDYLSGLPNQDSDVPYVIVESNCTGKWKDDIDEFELCTTTQVRLA